MIAFHSCHARNFQHFYLAQVQQQWRSAFPGLPSYQRFVEWMPSTLIPLCVYLKHCFGACPGIGFVAATSLKVSHHRRISGHRVFKDIAARGKTSVDWFFGFQLHLVVNQFGELLKVYLSNRTFSPSFPHQFLRQSPMWLDCLLPPTQEA
jgi:hypothetical protein